ncbi:MAG: SDR family oxidoreductase [Candidatus Sumerlaeia bacterium]|nr:SDR family oxidoreductase [Candidatus Sumerlaeia bacterium]
MGSDAIVITGASMGLGAEFARQLAGRGMPLVLVARNEAKLREVAEAVRSDFRADAHICVCDLAEPGAAKQVQRFLRDRALRPAWLVNNAGFGDAGRFESMKPERLTDTMMVNMVALVDLTRLLVPMMEGVPDARIINVASTASFQPVALFNVYAASKTFVLHFSEALHEELKPKGIKVLCLCPGPTATNFGVNNGLDAAIFAKGQTAEYVVRAGIRASDAGSALLVTQRKLAVMAQRFLPRWAVRKAAATVAKKFLKE